MTSNQNEMKDIARQFFKNLFSMQSTCDLSHILSDINNCISEDDNCYLMKPYTEEENLAALKSTDD